MNKIKPDFICLLLVCSLLLIYLPILPTQLTSANHGVDGGDLLTAILTNGIPHPTGYPTYVLLGQIFQKILIGTPYYRGAWASLIPAALGVGLISLLVGKKVIENKKTALICTLVTGVILGASQIYWSQAVIVEVYGLQAFFVAVTLWWLALLSSQGSSTQGLSKKRFLQFCGLSLCVGLGIGNHITILLLAPTCVYALIIARQTGFQFKYLGPQLILILLGTLVYLYLPLQAKHFPPINWGNPQTLSGFIWLVSGRPYHDFVFQISSIELIGRAGALARILVDQFGFIGVLAGIIGAIQSPLPRRPLREILIWVFGVYLIFSLIYPTNDSMVYLIPPFMIFAIWISLSIDLIWDKKWNIWPWGKLIGISLFIYFAIRIPLTQSLVNPSKDNYAALYAENYLRSAPQDALLLTDSDQDSFPLWYYHFGLGWRPDIRVIVLPLTQYGWYQQTIQHTYPDLLIPPVHENTSVDLSWGERFIQLNKKRSICYSKPDATSSFGINTKCVVP